MASRHQPAGAVRLFLLLPNVLSRQIRKGRNHSTGNGHGIRLMRAFLGDGLFTAEGDLWLRQRRLMQPAFHRERVAACGETMAAYAARRKPTGTTRRPSTSNRR